MPTEYNFSDDSYTGDTVFASMNYRSDSLLYTVFKKGNWKGERIFKAKIKNDDLS